MNLERLRIFVQIVDGGSMSAAARTAHLTQPALSRNLKQLEEDLDVELFARQGRGLVLTAAGRALVPRARALLVSSDGMAREVQRSAEREYFDVRFGTVDSVATFLVPRLIDPLTKRFPELAIRFATARTARLLERIRANQLDVAVIAHSGPPPDCRWRRVAHYDLQFYGRKDRFPSLQKAHATADLRHFPIVEIEPPPGDAAVEPERAQSYATASNVATVKALVLAGFGVGDLPAFMLSREERAGLCAAAVPHDPDCALYVVGAADWRGDVERRIEACIGDTLVTVLGGKKLTGGK